MSNQKSIKKNFILNALLTISSIIFPLITYPYVSRVLGPTGLGKIEFACSNISYFSLLAQLGIPTYGVKACATVRDNKLKLAQTVYELMLINLVMTLIAYVFLVPTLLFVPEIRDEKLLHIVISSTLLFNSIGIEYLYKGLEQYRYITIRSIAFKFVAVIAMFLLVRTKQDYIIYGGITIFAASASNIMNFIHSKKVLGVKVRGKLNCRRHLKSIMIFFAMTCATTIYLNMDRSMLGFMTTADDVGYYGASIKIKTLLVSLITSLGAVILPRASYYIDHKQFDEFKRITAKALRFVFVAAVPLMLFFIEFSREGILFVAGPEFAGAIIPMAILMPTLLLIGITNVLGIQVLVPLGKEKYVLYSEIVGAIVDLVLNLILIPRYKATGAAIGTLAAEFAVLVVQYYCLSSMRKEITILDSFKSIQYMNIVFALILAAPASLWIRIVNIPIMEGNAEVHNFILLAFAGVTFFGIYYLVMMLAKDQMMLEITNSVLGKFRKRKAST